MKTKLFSIILFTFNIAQANDPTWVTVLRNIKKTGIYYRDMGYYALTVNENNIANSIAVGASPEEQMMIGNVLSVWISWKQEDDGRLVGDKWQFNADVEGDYEHAARYRLVKKDGTYISEEFIQTTDEEKAAKWILIKDGWKASLK